MDKKNNKELLKIEDKLFLECERRWVFLVLMGVGGFFGGFTFTIRGGVFCNAQTANLLLLSVAAARGEWDGALYYFVPFIAYLLGTMLSESAAYRIKKLHVLRWDTLFIIFEMLCVVFLALLPESAPYRISQITVNVVCAMQFNTFRQAQGVPAATTFCTNHVRQVAVALTRLLRHHGGKAYTDKLALHGGFLGCFVLGVGLATILCARFQGKAILFLLLPLGVVLADFLRADLVFERDLIDKTPRGH